MAFHSRITLRVAARSMMLGLLILSMLIVTPVKAAPIFSQMTGVSNPFNGVDLGYYTTPTLGDLDGDGDLDALISADNGTISYYKNTGDAYAPIFTVQSGAANPFNGVTVGSRTTVTLADIDGDGDLDAFIGLNDGTIKFYRNAGTTNSPSFSAVTDTGNPFYNVDVELDSSVTLGDIDGDGDLDAIIGEADGVINYYRNDGTAITPSFSSVSGTGNPLNVVENVGSESRPTLADVDRDGDLDVAIGNWNGYINYYRNNGTSIAPSYSHITGSTNPFYGVSVGSYNTPVLCDIDHDGDLDAFFGDYIGTIYYYSNGDSPITPNFSEVTGADYPFDIMSFLGQGSAPALGDIDGDGDLDVFSGAADGSIYYFRNDGSAIAPSFTSVTDSGNPFSMLFGLQNTAPTLGDIDGDGDLDAFVGVFSGEIIYYRNDGSATTPGFTEVTDGNNPFFGITVANYSTPTLADMDGDGDLDAFIGAYDGTITFYQNIGTATTPSFSMVSDSNIPFDGVKVSPTLADADNDGDLDAFIGEYNGAIFYYQNFGTVITPTFHLRTGWDNPFNGVDVGGVSTPVLGDLDADGDQDAIIGGYSGTLKYYRNALPEMAVIGNSQVIVDGDISPTVNDDSEFGNVALGETITHTFTISNTSAGNLNLTGTPLISLSGAGAGDFSVVAQPANPIVNSGSSAFQISFTPSITQTQVAMLTLANNDSNENPYDFAIQGTGALPEMAVTGNSQVIVDGDVTPDLVDDTEFSFVISGETITHTFTISNSGLATLQLTGSPLVSLSGDGAGDFSVVVSPTTSVAPDATSTFQISFTPSVTYTQVATVTLANTDSDENPYDFAIQGIMGLPEIAVIGNGQEIADGDALPTVEDHTDFGNLTTGESVTHTFTISNSGNAELILYGSPIVSLSGVGASDFSVVAQPATPISPSTTTTFQIRFAPSITVTQVATVTIANNDGDENPYDFAIQGSMGLPEMAVIGNGQVIDNGDALPTSDDDTDFGSLAIGKAITHTFTISNSGSGQLILSGSPLVSLTGGGGDFNVVAQPVTPVDSGSTTTFRIRFTPSVSVTQAVTVTMVNNDNDENPYEFAIQGSGIFPAVTFTPNQFSIAEDGSQVVSATLSTQPDEDVTITFSSNNPSQCTVSPVLVTLDDTNWQSGASFVVSGVNDGISDGSQTCTIITSLVSNDDVYSDLDPVDIIVTVLEWRVYLPMILNMIGGIR